MYGSAAVVGRESVRSATSAHGRAARWGAYDGGMTDAKTKPEGADKKKLSLTEDDIRTERRGAGGSVGRIGAGATGASKVVDPNRRGPGAPTDPDA